MQRLQGIAVSPGVAIGEALVMDSEGFRIPRRFVARDAVDDELERLSKAIEAAAAFGDQGTGIEGFLVGAAARGWGQSAFLVGAAAIWRGAGRRQGFALNAGGRSLWRTIRVRRV